jgi:hypothetical protein
MYSKTSVSLSSVAIAALVLVFASGPIVSHHQALAVVIVHGHYGGYFPHYHHGYYGHYGGYFPHYHHGYYGHYGHYHGHYGHYHGHGYIHAGKTVMTPHGIYHKGVTVGAY